MASVYSAARSRTRSLPTPSFEHLGSTPGSTPLRRARRGCGRGPDAAPFKQDIDLLIEGLQLAAQRQQAEARQKLAGGLLGGAALAIILGSSRS